MKIKLFIIILFVLRGFMVYSQENESHFRAWKLMSISGEAGVKANYRQSEFGKTNFYIRQNDAYINGLLQLRTLSYFVHPNFVLVNLNANYNPETRRSSYVGLPDFTEKLNRDGFDVTALFFSKKLLNISTNALLNNSVQNADNISSIKTRSQQYGVTMSYLGRYLPSSVAYTTQLSDQVSLSSNRKYNFDQRIWQATASKSFASFDNHSVSYFHTENSSIEKDSNLKALPVKTKAFIDLLELSDGMDFDKKKNYSFNSSIINSNERGSFNLKRLTAREALKFKFPGNFTFENIYNLGLTEQESNKINFQSLQSFLSHQLFLSLNTRIFYEHNQTIQSTYNDERNKIGLNLAYTKKTPLDGRLTMLYYYNREFKNVKSSTRFLQYLREEYFISDNQLVILKSQNVAFQSVVIRNKNGSITYQLGTDYLLIDKKPYLEMLRIPGGLIPNNTSVFVDYTALIDGDYNYYMDNQSFSANLMLFKNLFEVFYRISTQDFSNESRMESQVLNYFQRSVTGIHLNMNAFKTGVEYENCRSTILPYEGMRYFLNFQKMYHDVFFTLNSNVLNFQMTSENSRRIDADVTCKLAYVIFRRVKLDLDYMYRSMKGRGLDMNISTSKFQVSTALQKLYISLETQFYWNNDIGSSSNYKGTFLQITRNF